MIEVRALFLINFLNLSENYDFMSRWLGVYDKYAKLFERFVGCSCKRWIWKELPESANDKVGWTTKHLALLCYISWIWSKLNKSHLFILKTVGSKPMIFVANVSAHYRWTSRARDIGTKEDQDAARSLIDQTEIVE